MKQGVSKVIHDCRMLSDAFLYRLDIVLTNVHDTLAWHVDPSVWRVWEPLDTVLLHNGLPRTLEQPGTQHCAYWARRPITAAMLSASLDGLENIITLSVLQARGVDHEIAESTTRSFLEWARGANTRVVSIIPGLCVRTPCKRRFLHTLQRHTGTLITCRPSNDGASEAVVYYKDPVGLDTVVQAIGFECGDERADSPCPLVSDARLVL